MEQPRYCEGIADFGHEIVYLDDTDSRFVWNVDGLESDFTGSHIRRSIVMVFFSPWELEIYKQDILIGIAPEGVTTTPNVVKVCEIPASVQPVA